jgi:hypothetical protein
MILDLGVAIEGARAAEAEHLLPRLEGLGSPRTAFWLDLGGRQSGPAAFYGLAEGSCIGIVGFDVFASRAAAPRVSIGSGSGNDPPEHRGFASESCAGIVTVTLKRHC